MLASAPDANTDDVRLDVQEALAVRLLTLGRMRGGQALSYLGVYLSLMLLYGVLLVVAYFSPRLGPIAPVWGIG